MFYLAIAFFIFIWLIPASVLSKKSQNVISFSVKNAKTYLQKYTNLTLYLAVAFFTFKKLIIYIYKLHEI